MRNLSRVLATAIVASPLLIGAGCAQRSDIDSLRSEVSALRTEIGVLRGDIANIDLKAQKVAADAAVGTAAAERAAMEAKAASDKADKIYRQSLRK